jgi:FMN phosphatase YigB (HAD superfamily)
MSSQPVIVFDANETLLDLDALHPVFDRIFGDVAALRLWFANLITYSEALTLAGVYVPFTDIGAAPDARRDSRHHSDRRRRRRADQPVRHDAAASGSAGGATAAG